MKTRIEVIDVEKAKHYLLLNRNNRPLNAKRVAQYAAEMKAGKWKEDTGEGLKLCRSGFLIDGQHRLNAVVLAGVSINMLVIDDLNPDIFDVLDTGRNRGTGDVLALNGVPNSLRVASFLKEYRAFKAGKFYKVTGQDDTINTNAAVLEAYLEAPEKYQAVERAAGRYYASFNRILPASNIASFMLLFSEKNAVAAEDFFNQLCGKAHNFSPSIDLLQKFLIKDKLAIRKASTKLRYALIIKAWNAYRLNKNLKCLKYTEGSEDFPVIL